MPVTLQLVMKLRHLTQQEAAERLRLPVADVVEAARMGAVTMRYLDVEPPPLAPSDEERAALRERIPKKRRSHYGPDKP